MIQLPSLALLAIVAIDLIFLTRMVTIIVFPLEPPPGLIILEDPISNFFYGKSHEFITRDLFFSGHTSSMIMIGLLLPRKCEKRLAFAAALAVGCLVLVQHIHYTIDVLGAWVFTWLLYRLAKVMVVIPQNASPN
jgi:membrane-associated phospholipid phosphatase